MGAAKCCLYFFINYIIYYIMAKKKKETMVEEPVVEETVVMEEPVVESPRVEIKPEPQKPKWEVRDRMYYLANNMSPLTLKLKTSNLFWYDKEKGYERQIMYSRNQKTVFVDEMKGVIRPGHVVFADGVLYVPKEKQTLQKFLSLYHPHLDTIYHEKDSVSEAKDEVENIMEEVEALNIAMKIDIDMAEAVMRAEIGSEVSNLSSKELKRDLLVFAKNNPRLFVNLVSDENIHLRNIGIKAVESGIIRISQDQRSFHWSSNDRKLMTVPFDEHPYSALAQWFKTDEGMNVLASIEKRLN